MHNLTRRTFLAAAGALGSLPRIGGRQNAPRISLTCADYVRFMPIASGDVRPKGFELTWIRGDRADMLRRALEDAGVDGGETSMAQHVMRLGAGDRSFVAVPIFPLRNFTARDLYTRRGSTLTEKTLGGRRVGIYNWAASGAVWYRHLLRHLGHDTTKISWIVGGPDGPAAVRIPDPPPPHVSAAPAGTSLSELLLRGEIDAFFAPLPPKTFDAVNGPIVRVFTDYRGLEQRYYAETRCYPPQHVVVLRRAAWERHRSAARELVRVFNTAEDRFETVQRLYPYNSPWLIGDVEEAARVMGPRYHAHGFDENRHAVDTFCQGAYDDGLTKRRVSASDFFAEFLKT